VYIDNPKPSTHEGGYQKIERVGDHVKNIDDLLVAIEQNLALDKDRVREMLCGVIKNCYGNTLDGNSAQRYDTAIRELLQIN
jgi:hypothetical protein